MAEDKDKGFSVVDRRIKFDESDDKAEKKPAEDPGKPEAAPEPAAKSQDSTSSEPEEADKTEQPQPPLPPVSFSTFVLSLHGSALIHLGLIPNPANQKQQVDLEFARHNVDLLEMLKEKTKGNLSGEENNLLDNILYELRMVYLEVCKKINKGECEK